MPWRFFSFHKKVFVTPILRRTGDKTAVYLSTESRTPSKYVAHVQRMLELLGNSPDAAQREATRIMEMETQLAKASLTRVQRRDPRNLYHKADLKQLQALTPDFDMVPPNSPRASVGTS